MADSDEAFFGQVPEGTSDRELYKSQYLLRSRHVQDEREGFDEAVPRPPSRATLPDGGWSSKNDERVKYVGRKLEVSTSDDTTATQGAWGPAPMGAARGGARARPPRRGAGAARVRAAARAPARSARPRCTSARAASRAPGRPVRRRSALALHPMLTASARRPPSR